MGHFYIITLIDLVKAATWALPRVHAWSTGHVFSCMSGSRHNAAQRWGGFPGFCWQSSGLLSLFWLLSNDIQCMHWIISCYLHLRCHLHQTLIPPLRSSNETLSALGSPQSPAAWPPPAWCGHSLACLSLTFKEFQAWSLINFRLQVEVELGRILAHETLEMLLCAIEKMFLGREGDFGANLADILRVLLPWSVAQIFPVLRLRVTLGGLLKCRPECVWRKSQVGKDFEIFQKDRFHFAYLWKINTIVRKYHIFVKVYWWRTYISEK